MGDGSAITARHHPSLGFAVGTFVVAAGWVIGLRPLSDNSFFTHLATGRIILDTGSVPSSDPYTFTAHGTAWLVQSWLASVLYATVERVGGAVGIRLLMGVVAAVLAALAWRLTRSASSILPRLAIGALFVTVGGELWSQRPLMLGLVAFACVMLAGDGLLDPRWLLPIAWVWVNVHGSFPLGVVYLGAIAIGHRLDGESPVNEMRALRWLASGVVLGAVGPLGPGVLSFPLELLQRQDVLRNVIEWRAPAFDSLSQRAFLAQLVLVMLALVRRPTYRSGLVVAVFTAAALLGVRNLTVASLVFLPTLASAAPGWGSLRNSQRTSLSTATAMVGVVVAIALGAARLGEPDFELRGYPIDALAFVETSGIDLADHRMATQDVVGNLMELVYGPRGFVFYDDRFDMFPRSVSREHLALVRGSPSLRVELARADADLVLWDRTTGTGQRLITDPAWRVLYSDDQWVLVCLRGSHPPLDGAQARC